MGCGLLPSISRNSRWLRLRFCGRWRRARGRRQIPRSQMPFDYGIRRRRSRHSHPMGGGLFIELYVQVARHRVLPSKGRCWQ
eukprot:16123887-Heterocapsa_arctica.AAC.1